MTRENKIRRKQQTFHLYQTCNLTQKMISYDNCKHKSMFIESVFFDDHWSEFSLALLRYAACFFTLSLGTMEICNYSRNNDDCNNHHSPLSGSREDNYPFFITKICSALSSQSSQHTYSQYIHVQIWPTHTCHRMKGNFIYVLSVSKLGPTIIVN